MSDLRFALRQFLRKPGFTATTVLVLALSIGANVAVYSLVTAFNFSPLPVRDPDQLVAVTVPEAGRVFSEPRYAALSGQTKAFDFSAYGLSTPNRSSFPGLPRRRWSPRACNAAQGSSKRSL